MTSPTQDNPTSRGVPRRGGAARRGRSGIPGRSRRAFTVYEAVGALVVVIVLVSVLLPMLFRARNQARLDRCRLNQTSIGAAWLMHLRETEAFPDIEEDPDWRYAGVSFSRVSGEPALDFARPLNRHLEARWRRPGEPGIFESPLDRGIISPNGRDGTGGQTAYRFFGTSYRANAMLLDARITGMDNVRRPLRVTEVSRPHDQVVIMGPPFWFETLYRTGRQADWYERPGAGPVLFMDGSVRDIAVRPETPVGDGYSFTPVERTGEVDDPNASARRDG